MRIYALVFFITGLVTFGTACTGQHEHNGDHDHAAGTTADHQDEADMTATATDPEFQRQLGAVTTAYLQLKDQLVAADAKAAGNAARDMNNKLGMVDMSLVKGDRHQEWMDYLRPLQTAANQLTAATDLEGMRRTFSGLAEPLAAALNSFGKGDSPLYVQRCPMAFNNEGANWISSEKAIRNPYFGDMMMSCGKVIETIQ
ncbi:MAG: DUF3347 domain-containing protein [Saprospiraceae bacterium]